jgi:adenylate cyclase class 2
MIVHEDIVSEETQSLLLELLRRIYSSDTVITNVSILNHRVDYAALLVSIDHPTTQLAIKLAGRKAPYAYPFDRTANWYRLVAERTSIPMPQIIDVDVSYSEYPWRYLIKSYIPGETWATVRPMLQESALRQAYEQIGKAVGELHSITFEHFGFKWTNYYTLMVQRVKASLLNHVIKENLLKLLETNQSLFTQVKQPRLCHEDLHPHNILFQQTGGEWHLATILDFDKAWAGHHEIDLAKMDLWDGMIGDGFWERYTEIINVDTLYPQRRPIYQLWWCLEYAANTPKHLADTRKLCEELGFPLIERFESRKKDWPMNAYNETEMKLYVPDLQSVQKKLDAAGATLKAPRVYERNVRYDDAARSLTPKGIVVRLREDTRVRLTYKDEGNATDGIVSRFEAEVEVSDFDAMETILGKMGYSPYLVYEKYRTTYELENTEIVLDEMPYGHFVEIEGEAGTIKKLVTTLDLGTAKQFEGSYSTLFERLRQKLGLTFSDLTFENFKGVTVKEEDFEG